MGKGTFTEYVRECARDMATGKLASGVEAFLAFCWETYKRMPDLEDQ